MAELDTTAEGIAGLIAVLLAQDVDGAEPAHCEWTEAEPRVVICTLPSGKRVRITTELEGEHVTAPWPPPWPPPRRPLYRSHARCIAILPHRHLEQTTIELELETDTGDRVRLTLDGPSLRRHVGNLAPLFDAPLTLELGMLEPHAGDRRPHSRACGWLDHPHGRACSTNCPTCHGRPYHA